MLSRRLRPGFSPLLAPTVALARPRPGHPRPGRPVWSMPHLVSRRLLSMNKVMTNNGSLTGYFEFDPAVLAEAADVIVDDFEK